MYNVGFFMSLAGSLMFFVGLFVWIMIFQLSWKTWDNSTSYMIFVPEEDETGW